MSHQVTVTLKLEVKEGPKLEPKVPPLNVDAYMPLNAEIKNDKQWHTLRLDAGSKEYIKFLVIESDVYKPEACPPNGHALYVQFIANENDPIDAMKMDGPHLYLGPSLDLLPAELSLLRFKNTLPLPANVKIMLGKEAYIPEDDKEEVGEMPAPAERPM